MADASPELVEVSDFLAATAPFSGLTRERRDLATRRLKITYFRRGTTITAAGEPNGWLSIIRAGAVELKLGGTELSARLGEHDCFGYPSLIRRGPAQNEAIAIEDCLLYRIPAEIFDRLRGECPDFRAFFDIDEAARLRRAVRDLTPTSGGATDGETNLQAYAPLGTMIARREIVTCAPDQPIGEAADLMTREDVSTLPVCENGRLIGILTDKDLRRRVLARRLDLATPVRAVMTPDPVTVLAHDTVMSALLEMTDRHIHHLPLVGAGGELLAVISSSDLMAQLGANIFHVRREVEAAVSSAEVRRATAQLPRAVSGLVAAGVDADHLARYVSSIGEAAHRRLLALAEAQLGAPPVPYALVGFGSLARGELSLWSDQDNGFVFGEGYDAALHDAYFAELGGLLCEGLDAAGYRFCPGNIMASNADYRRPVEAWLMHFARWIDEPDPQAILQAGIFFDMRAIAGEAGLVETLRAQVFARAAANRIFVSFVARAAAATAVPLGFFRNFLLQDDADEGHVLDLKAQAITPIIDIARTHAIAGGLTQTGTIDRLEAAVAAGSLDAEAARDLIACFEFVRDVRFRHQAQQVASGHVPTNKLDPQELTRFDREHLRDAFRLIRSQLDRLRSAYAGGLT